jgi:hypothetical protein
MPRRDGAGQNLRARYHHFIGLNFWTLLPQSVIAIGINRQSVAMSKRTNLVTRMPEA